MEDINVYQWPGNVRELLNTFDLICSEVSPGSILFPHHLPGHIRAAVIRKK
ncbi:AAA-type ATPase lid domain-containing protein [Desulfocicer niacini]